MDSDIFDHFFGKGHFKCPDSDKWRRVIESKLPHCKSDEKEKAYEALKTLGLASSGSHSLFTKDGKSVEGMSVIRVGIIEDTLEDLMKHQHVDGAKFHGYNQEIMCPDCIAEKRKDAYDGTDKVPEILCPICSAVLIPLHKSE
jgi:hypothetical protein